MKLLLKTNLKILAPFLSKRTNLPFCGNKSSKGTELAKQLCVPSDKFGSYIYTWKKEKREKKVN